MLAMTTLTALIIKLSKAEEGSRELDEEIARAIDFPLSADPLGWPPHFSSSLDAKLPGENIIFSMCHKDGLLAGLWEALHDTENGSRTPLIHGTAKTEPLARRLACLSAYAEASADKKARADE